MGNYELSRSWKRTIYTRSAFCTSMPLLLIIIKHDEVNAKL